MKEIYISPELQLVKMDDVVCTSGEFVGNTETETEKIPLSSIYNK